MNAFAAYRQGKFFTAFAPLLLGVLVAMLLGLGNQYYEYAQSKAFYDHLNALESKSDAHRMMLSNMVFCLRDEGLPESSCITNTILLAEVNGYKDDIARVFQDAEIATVRR